MCDYSLHVANRPARVGDCLITHNFGLNHSIGLRDIHDDHGIEAVCLRPGTELAFAKPAKYYAGWIWWPYSTKCKMAIFRQIDVDNPYVHHDAVEMENGMIIKIGHMAAGQRVRVLQLPQDVDKTVETITVYPIYDPVFIGTILPQR